VWRIAAPSTFPGGLLFIPSCAADGSGSMRWWDGGGELLFPVASSPPPLAWRTAVAAGRGGTAAAGSWPDPLVFCFFYSFEKLFAESLKILTALHCSEHKLQLTS
jgi:hypothetical protein